MPLKVATSPQYKDLFKAALQAEVQSFKDNKVFASFHNLSELDPFAAAPGITKLPLNLLCSEKFDELGELERLKARAIADGSQP
jgi:predicted house-cleaning noncanonical NTP pyrophosphatase (MazG superfamily)